MNKCSLSNLNEDFSSNNIFIFDDNFFSDDIDNNLTTQIPSSNQRRNRITFPFYIWKSIRVMINDYLFKKLNMLSNQYYFSNFYKFDAKISTKKEDNENLLNGTIENYIIESGISGNYNKKRKINENKNINNLDNSNLIEKILNYEKEFDNKPFTNFMNMKFKKFYFNIFLEDNTNNLNENNNNLKNFYQYIKDYNEERKKIYINVAKNIYNILKIWNKKNNWI